MVKRLTALTKVSSKSRNSGRPHTVYIRTKGDGMDFIVRTNLVARHPMSYGDFDVNESNRSLKKVELLRILEKFEEYMLLNPDATKVDLRSSFTAIIEGKEVSKKRFISYLEEYIKTIRRDSTRTMFIGTMKKIVEFDAEVTFDTMNAAWLKKFEHYWLHSMSQNGFSIHLRNIRAVFNWARANEYTVKYPFRLFKIKEERVPIRNLSVDEIRQLRDYPVEPWQEVYRDLFMLSFYLCGINAGDLLECTKLTRGRFVYRRKKTNKMYDIPVYPEAQAIIDKYRGENYLLNPMDRYASYKDFLGHWNTALQKIGPIEKVKDRAGNRNKLVYHPLFDDITTYCARYSFASIAAELDIPRETIALCLGHSWAQDVTSRYINYDKKKIDAALRKVIDYVNSR